MIDGQFRSFQLAAAKSCTVHPRTGIRTRAPGSADVPTRTPNMKTNRQTAFLFRTPGSDRGDRQTDTHTDQYVFRKSQSQALTEQASGR